MRLSKVLYLLLGLFFCGIPARAALDSNIEASPLDCPPHSPSSLGHRRYLDALIEAAGRELIKAAFDASAGDFEQFYKTAFGPPPVPSARPHSSLQPPSTKEPESGEEHIKRPQKSRKETQASHRKKRAQVVAYIESLAPESALIKGLLDQIQSLNPSQEEEYAAQLQALKTRPITSAEKEKARHALHSKKSREKTNSRGVIALYWDLVQRNFIPHFDDYYAPDIQRKEKIAVGDFGRTTHDHTFHPYS